MFRGYMPLLTLIVFGIGTGLGISFCRGLIPLTITPANSGRLSEEYSVQEPLPPPPDEEEDLASQQTNGEQSNPDSQELEQLTNQSEPETDDRSVAAPVKVRQVKRSTSTQFSDADLDSAESENSSTKRRQTRDRNEAPLNAQAVAEESSSPQKRRKVVATAHQDISDSSSDSGGSSREANTKGQPPEEKLAAAKEKLEIGETRAALRDLSELYWHHKAFRPQIQDLLDTTADSVFFQPKPHYVDPHVVQSGERLEVIAKKHQLSWEYVARLNQIDPRRIQGGQKLKVMKGPFGAVVDLRDFALTVHLHGYYVKRYDVGIGKDGSSPTGKFLVKDKIVDPQYTDDRTGKVTEGGDPTNPLGKRWIDLGNSYGIHGTIDPNSIGKSESRGCIRLRDTDIVEVYDFLVKGSEVVLRK